MDTPVLVVECNEPEGKVMREVRLTHLSMEKMKFLWERLSKFDVLFNDFVRGDLAAFINHFVVMVDGEPTPTGLMWDIDDVGIFLLNEIKPMESASAHLVFWDKRFRGREELCREMLKYVFKEYGFRRIKVEIPLYATLSLNAMERIGFTKEGRMRKAVKYKGEWFDVNIYSILPEELNGS
jgi:RimJ/RimL family protein N-acetyltransferase